MAQSPDAPRGESYELADFVSDALEHTRELVRAELELAKAELKRDARRASAGALAVLIGGSMLGCALVVALAFGLYAVGAGAISVAILGLALGLIGLAGMLWGRRRLTAPHLQATRKVLTGNAGRSRELERKVRYE